MIVNGYYHSDYVPTAFGKYPIIGTRRYFRDDEWDLAIGGLYDLAFDPAIDPRQWPGVRAAIRLRNVAEHLAEREWLAGRPLGHRTRIRVPARSRRVA